MRGLICPPRAAFTVMDPGLSVTLTATRGQQLLAPRDNRVFVKFFDPLGGNIRQALFKVRFQSCRSSLLLSKPPERIGGHINPIWPDHVGAKLTKLDAAEKLRGVTQGRIGAKRIHEARHIDAALITIAPANAQCERLRIRFDRSDSDHAAHLIHASIILRDPTQPFRDAGGHFIDAFDLLL